MTLGSETKELIEVLRELADALELREETDEHIRELRKRLKKLDPDREEALFMNPNRY